MKLRTALYSSVALALAATGSLLGVAATSASATPPPPTVIHTTSIQTSAIHLGPRVSVLRFAEYQPAPKAPGFAETSTILEVCLAVPHIVPPLPATTLAVCNWRLTNTAAPHSTIAGTAVQNGLGQIGRVTSGTKAWVGAHGLPGSFTAVDIAPRTQADTFVFVP